MSAAHLPQWVQSFARTHPRTSGVKSGAGRHDSTPGHTKNVSRIRPRCRAQADWKSALRKCPTESVFFTVSGYLPFRVRRRARRGRRRALQGRPSRRFRSPRICP